MKFVGSIQRLLLIIGLVLVAIYVIARIDREVSSRAELKRFKELPAESRVAAPDPTLPLPGTKVDVSLWSGKRISAYESSLAEHFNAPLAILRIPKFQLEVPVLEGTDDLTLNRGAGHITGTVRPGEEGNVGIAGHRDGFFRVLKDIGPGDKIEMETIKGTDTYVVDQIVLVKPDDVSVLQPRPYSSLTLVTCYPFYYLGSAPQRYIVQASIANPDALALHAVKRTGSDPDTVVPERSSNRSLQ